MKGMRIVQADFTEILGEVEGCADLVFTSPPYCGARSVDAYGVAKEWTAEDYKILGDLVMKALRPGGHAIINVDAPVREWREGFGPERGFHPWMLMLDWAERVGFRVPDRLIFKRMGARGSYVGRFRNDFEPLLWFQKLGGEVYFDKSVMDQPSVWPTRKGSKRSVRNHEGSMDVRGASGDAVERSITRRGTVWSYNVGHNNTGSKPLERAKHPASFPLTLALDVVGCFCPPGGLVVDPFVGAGTTAVASRQLGRRFVGGDLGTNLDGRPWAEVAEEIVYVETIPDFFTSGTL